MARADEQFAQWLATNYPDVFGAVLNAATEPTKPLAGWGDTLSSIGSAIASTVGKVAEWGGAAISSVANFVTSPQGQQTVAKLADLYVSTQANKDAINVQLSNLTQGNAPAPIATQTNQVTGTTIPIYQPPGAMPQVLTPQLSQQLFAAASQPANNYMVPLAIGGGVLLLVLLTGRRRR